MKRNELTDKIKQLESETIKVLKQNVDDVQVIAKLRMTLNDQNKAIALDLISLVEAFELKFQNINQIDEEGKLNEEEKKISRSFQSILRKLYRLLEKYDVKEIIFEDNKMRVGLCKIVDTKPDQLKENGTILYTIKKGYYIGDKVLCEAEVVTVKN